MADVIKVLGQADPGATTETVVYTVPVGASAVLSSVTFCNRAVAARDVRLYIAVAGVATADEQYVVYDQEVAANETLVIQLGITISELDEVRVYHSDADVSVNVFGVEQSIVSTVVADNVAVRTEIADYTADSDDFLIRVDCSAGDVTITLPEAAVSLGKMYMIKKVDATGNKVIIDGDGTDEIDGSTTQDLLLVYEAVQLICNGTGWDVV